jgi:predicted DNA-binding ribbon-helix-helix protein
MDGGPAFAPPRKRSVTIAGHETSISLEPMFWAALEESAKVLGRPLSALIADIDVARLEVRPVPNLTSAIRQWLFREALRGSDDSVGESVLGVGDDVEP